MGTSHIFTMDFLSENIFCLRSSLFHPAHMTSEQHIGGKFPVLKPQIFMKFYQTAQKLIVHWFLYVKSSSFEAKLTCRMPFGDMLGTSPHFSTVTHYSLPQGFLGCSKTQPKSQFLKILYSKTIFIPISKVFFKMLNVET